MPRRSDSKRYTNLDGQYQYQDERASTPWYWRFIASVASWMILAGYLILPGLYAKKPELKFSQAVLSVFVVALLTAGYSFTALLCFACRSEKFQAEAIFLPALASSALGLISIAYNFLASRSYDWNTAAITGTVVSTTSTVLYGILLLWTHRRIVLQDNPNSPQSPKRFSEPSFYSNWFQNMYPAAIRPPSVHAAETRFAEDDQTKQHLASLLRRPDSGPSPDAASATFRIDLPEDQEEQLRQANSSELLGSPPATHAEWNRSRALSEEEAWLRWDRGRTQTRPTSVGASSRHSRALSREERRREIELGQV